MKNTSKSVSETDTKTNAEIPVDGGKYVYIGPSLPNDGLITNTVISGKKEEIVNYYKEIIERFPNVKQLIVPVERLADCRTKIKSSGNVLNKYYNDLVQQIKQKGAAE